MRPNLWRRRVVLSLAFTVLLMAPGRLWAFRYADPSQGHDFILFGLGSYRQNITRVGGDALRFEESDEGLPSDFSNSSRLSLFGEGKLYHDSTFEVEIEYDEENPERDNRYYLRLDRGQSYMLAGDQRDGLFQETVFTALEPQLRGLTLHGETASERAGVTLAGGVLRGDSASDEIRADGTSGPYRLEEAPVVPGSERVRIEVRDRSNPRRVLNSKSQTRGRDYTIDNDDGEITFDRPVAEQDFRGNPAFIVVSYQFDGPGDLFKRAAWGSRVQASPHKAVGVGITYLADSAWDGGGGHALWDERREIVGSDVTLKWGDRYKLAAEVARSDTPEAAEATPADALRLALDTRPSDRLRIYGRYWSVERDFLTFGNPDLSAGIVGDLLEEEELFEFRSASLELDLDPNIDANLGVDERSYGLSAAFEVAPRHSLSAGFRQTRNNVPDDGDQAVDTGREVFSSYKHLDPQGTSFLLGVERNEDFDNLAPSQQDSRSDRLLGALRHPLGTLGPARDLFLQTAYQLERFQDLRNPENDNQTHDLLGRLDCKPIKDLTLYLEQAEQLIHAEREDDWIERTDISMLGAEGEYNRYLTLDASARLRQQHDLLAGEQTEREQIYTLSWRARPLERMRTRLRAEYRLLDDLVGDLQRERTIVGGEVRWEILSRLQATVSYDYEVEDTEESSGNGERTVTDDLLLRLDWKWRERLSLFGYYRREEDRILLEPVDETRAPLTTVLLGAKYRFNDKIELLTAYRYKLLEDEVREKRYKYFCEAGYWLTSYLQVALGYERYGLRTENEADAPYDADVAYLSLVAKF